MKFYRINQKKQNNDKRQRSQNRWKSKNISKRFGRFQFILRSFSAFDVDEKTLASIYKCGPNLEFISLVGCGIRKLPENFFLCLPKVKGIDLRNNCLASLPQSIAYHPNLRVMLLAGNLFKSVPFLLHTLPKLSRHDLSLQISTIIGQEEQRPFITAVSYDISWQSKLAIMYNEYIV